MIEALKRLWRWLIGEPEQLSLPYMEVIKLREESFEMGRAVGQLEGRMDLAKELAALFPPECRQPMTAEDARNIKLRQVH